MAILLPYRLYSDACDFGLAAILQQVQKVQLKDLKGTKVYKRCEKAFEANKPITSLVVQFSKSDNDVPKNGNWGSTLGETWVHIKRVIAYWSRVLKSAERNYSPTKQETLEQNLPKCQLKIINLGNRFCCLSKFAHCPSSRKDSF
jgi:hypothetical protein